MFFFLLLGWHRRMNGKAAHSNLPFYKLILLLGTEAETVDIQIRLVSDNLLCKIRRKKYTNIHGLLEKTWDGYEEEELTTTGLIRRAIHINGFGPLTEN